MHVRSFAPRGLVALFALAVLGLPGCGKEGTQSGLGLVAPGSAPVAGLITLPFDKDDFVNGVPNDWFPLEPGTVYRYHSGEGEDFERNLVRVTDSTKTIEGVVARVVHDQVFIADGSLHEDTFDWYAEDQYGNVWYLGEDTRTYDHGTFITDAGSWEAGKNGARAGIIMLADPKIGDTYFQENAPGVVEDKGKVMSLKETVTVPYGTFTNCLQTSDWTHLEPGNRAFKYYAKGKGLVLEDASKGGHQRVELQDITGP